MSWRRWKLGAAVAVVLALIVAGAGVAAGMKWQSFVAVFCTALLTHFGSFIKDHPVEQITFDTEQFPQIQQTAPKAAGQNALPPELPKQEPTEPS